MYNIVCLKINIKCSKHVEDKNTWIKNINIRGRCEEWFEEDGGDQMETKDAREEAMERNNWAS